MFKKFTMTVAMAGLATTGLAVMPQAAQAQRYHHHHRYYHHHYRRCGGGNGAVGTIAGGVGGAVLGNVLGGGTLGTVAGGVGGALVGRHFDKQHTRSRRGC